MSRKFWKSNDYEGPRPAETYRADRRAKAIKAAKDHRKAVRLAAIAGREAPSRPKPWSRVTPARYVRRSLAKAA